MPDYTTTAIAEFVDARLEGDGERVIRGVAPVAVAGPEDLTFLERPGLLKDLSDANPGAILVRHGTKLPELDATLLRVDHPEAAFARALALFHPEPATPPEIHPTAIVGRSVRFGEGVTIGPYVIVQDDAAIGDRTTIGPSALVGASAVIGADCDVRHGASVLARSELGDRVVVSEGARIGTEGFGFATTDDGALRIPQVGRCIIEDDVEIGANCTIDRGALGDTRIGARTKLDNLVQIGHNVVIGRDCMIVAQVGIAGSTRVGDGVALAGQVGLAGHLTIGNGARIAARAAVFKSVPAGATYSGTPARPHRADLRARASVLKLPDVLARLSALERKLDEREPAD